jgi:hypothetical protein
MYAKIDWQPNASELVATALAASAEVPSVGVDVAGAVAKADLQQLAAGLALYRDSNMLGARNLARLATFDAQGSFLGIVRADPTDPQLGDRVKQFYAIAGDGPIVNVPGGAGLPDNWGAQLARATDDVLRRIAKAKQTDPGAGMITPAVAPAVVAIIVGGAALAVVAGAAAWRYLDPDLRRDVAQVQAAATMFSARLQTNRETGKMPDPSPVETGVAKRIEKLAKDETQRGLLVGGAVVGGLVAAVGATLAIRRAMR